jgi:hypothetical protein
MKRLLLGVIVLAGCVACLAAGDSTKLPSSPAPNHATAHINKDGSLVLRESVIQTTYQYREETIESKDGGLATRRVRVPVTVMHEVTRNIEAKDIHAYNTEGKKLDAKDLANFLKKDTPVLVSADGKKVDPYYLQIIKEGTVVLVVPVPKTIIRPTPRPKDFFPKDGRKDIPKEVPFEKKG